MSKKRIEDVVEPQYAEQANISVRIGESVKHVRQIIHNRTVVDFEDYFAVGVLLKREFTKLHNIKMQALDYCITAGIVDYVRIGNTNIILMTDVTKKYSPKANVRRGKIGANIKRV